MYRAASIRRIFGLTLALALGGVLLSNRLGAIADSLVAVTSPSALDENDSTTWSQLGANGASLSASFNASSAGGVAITGALANSGSLVSVVCPEASCSWFSNDVAGFAAGDSLIWTSDAANGGNGPLTLTFNTSVMGAGALIQADGPGQFTAQIQAFNGKTSLGSFTTTSDTSGDAVFLGVVDNSAAHVTSVEFSLTNCTGACSDFAIDTLYLNDGVASGPTPTATGTISTGPTPTATARPAGATTLIGAPAQVEFGNVDATGASKAHKLSFINKGSANATTGTLSLPSGFAVVASTDFCSDETIAPKKSCSVMVEFTPAVPGAVSGSVSLPYNGSSPASIAVSGNGTAVSLKAPGLVKFAPTLTGSTGKPRPITITNLSKTATVLLGQVNLSGAYAIPSGNDGCSNIALGARQHCVVSVEFQPPPSTPPSTAMPGSLGLGYTYGSNSGAMTVTLSATVK